jgi:lipoate-protein ligase A
VTVNEDLLQGFEKHGCPVYRLYEPRTICVVLGAGRKDKGDVRLREAREDRVPVLNRRGGGGTVVLSPGMVVLALVTEVPSPYQNREYARKINDWQRSILSDLGVGDIRHQGISDLTVGDRKILGTSIFRKRHLLFYQSSLLVANDIGLFERYLTFPSTVPDYRRRRSHGEFCTNLHGEGYNLSTEAIIKKLTQVVSIRLPHL